MRAQQANGHDFRKLGACHPMRSVADVAACEGTEQ